jgi:4-hydroxybenzoate polyprenyltransferase
MTAPLDSAFPDWIDRLPRRWRPFALLARLDRPVGIWLLFLPCVIGLLFQRAGTGLSWLDPLWVVLFLAGSVVMRGAGCTWNDIRDRDLDAGVARTAGRPLPAGLVTLNEAYLFLIAQLAAGFVVWMFLPRDAKLIALLALPLVAAYPLMKRVTWWPQAWLGATFNWGALVGAATATSITPQAVLLYLGLAAWTIAYDTIYALQDRDDDALMGVKSTARLFGERAVLGALSFHIGAAALIALAVAANGAGRLEALAVLIFIGHGVWQSARLKQQGPKAALAVFKSNVWAGAILAAGFLLPALTPARAGKDVEAAPASRERAGFRLPFFAVEQEPVWFVTDLGNALKAEGILPEEEAAPAAPEEKKGWWD